MDSEYINLILEKCIKTDSKSLYIRYYTENRKFIDELVQCAKKRGFKDIYLDEENIEYELQLLDNLSLEQMSKHAYFNRKGLEIYSEKKAAILFVSSVHPHVYDHISDEKLKLKAELHRKSMQVYLKKAMNDEFSWTIFPLANEIWAKEVFPNEKHPYKKLEQCIYQFNFLGGKSLKIWQSRMDFDVEKCTVLNNLSIKQLHIKTKLGTDVVLSLVNNYIFRSLETNHFVENMPTYSIWSMPHKYKVDGIIYGSYPMTSTRGVVDDFWLKFEKGKVVNYDAKIGKVYLDELLSIPEMCHLGEIALVDYDNPIAKTNKVFYNNIIDENAVTHLALGASYSNTVKDGINMSEKEADENGCNKASMHKDFMIGTDDMSIVATLTNGQEVQIFKDGNFNYSLINRNEA